MKPDRRHYNADGVEKQKYTKKEGAQKRLEYLYSKKVIRLFNVYYCPICGYWHIGHKQPSKNMTRESLNKGKVLVTQIDEMHRQLERISDAVVNDPKGQTIAKLNSYGDFQVDKETFQKIAGVIYNYYAEITDKLEKEFEEL